jgi:oligosaccharide repeat unit polymerase
MGTGRLAAATRRLSIGGALLVLLAFLSFGGRAPFFGAILTALVLYHYLKKPLQFGKLTIIAVILFAWLSVYGYLRDLTLGNSTDWLESVGLSGPMQPFAYCYLYIRQSVATFRDVVQVIPSQVPYQYGAITTLPFQSVLPGHHQMSDWFFRNLLGNEFVGQGQPASILGPFYADFGPVGIFVGMFAWGLLMSKLYRWMLKDRRLIPTMIFAWTTQAGLFGLFGGVFGYLDALMIPLCWVLLDFLIRPLAHRTKLPHRVQGIA